LNRQAFGFYLSKEVIDKVLEDPARLVLGGERKELSIFFSDLAGFSSISERMNPMELTALLNDYLSEMSDIILEEGGTLDKYEGDAILAFWNAPLDIPDHAERACRAALRCQRKLREKAHEYQKIYGVELKARIGIHTGEVVVGNMGSKDRFDYTVLGDAANLASRLEGANKAFDSQIMVSGTTQLKAKTSILFRKIAPITVVGRKESLWVYEPVGFVGENFPEVELWQQAINAFVIEDFVQCKVLFQRNLPWPKEVKNWLLNLENKTWDGIFHLDNK
jgi:adenylate cyclase